MPLEVGHLLCFLRCYIYVDIALLFKVMVDLERKEKGGEKKKESDSGGIRTHAFEKTAALMQRLRPLGHEIAYIHCQ